MLGQNRRWYDFLKIVVVFSFIMLYYKRLVQ
jgi:hypothetical protein